MRLEARGLAFGYPGKPVGRDVDLALGGGEVVCLLGPNDREPGLRQPGAGAA